MFIEVLLSLILLTLLFIAYVLVRLSINTAQAFTSLLIKQNETSGFVRAIAIRQQGRKLGDR